MSSKIVIFTAPSITTKLGKLHATRGETFQSNHCLPTSSAYSGKCPNSLQSHSCLWHECVMRRKS
uniref:Uncharacterized protein n=1 Tax=Medicago truncatula TaxID=3880 RepID=I3SJQ4_MEDTR|nr:unknown [Medicago truncatula]